MIKICLTCQKKFDAQGQDLYCCDECRKDAMRKPQNEKPKNPKKRKSRIDEINAEARKLGMTYGKYVALMKLKEGEANATWLDIST